MALMEAMVMAAGMMEAMESRVKVEVLEAL